MRPPDPRFCLCGHHADGHLKHFCVAPSCPCTGFVRDPKALDFPERREKPAPPPIESVTAIQRAVRIVVEWNDHVPGQPVPRGRTLAELIAGALREVELERDAALARAQTAEDELAVARRELAQLVAVDPRDELGEAGA